MRPGLIVLLLVLVCVFSATAQTPRDEVHAGVEARSERIEAIAREIETPEADLAELRDTLREIIDNAETSTAPLRDELGAVRSDLDQLGAPPGEDEPPETEEIRAERERLNTTIAQLNGTLGKADLNKAEPRRLIETIAELRREAFSEKILARGPSPLSPAEWTRALKGGSDVAGNFVTAFGDWRSDREDTGAWGRTVGAIMCVLALALALFIPIRRRLDRAIKRRTDTIEPSPSRRVLVAALRAAARVVPGVIGGVLVYQTLQANGAIPDEARDFFGMIWLGVVALLLVDGGAVAVFSPRRPAWRVAALESTEALTVRWLVLMATLVIMLELIIIEAAELFAPSASDLVYLVKAASAVLLSVTLFLLCRSRLWRKPEAGASDSPNAEVGAASPSPALPVAPETSEESSPTPRDQGWRLARRIGRVLAVLALVAVLVGYVALGHYAMSRLFYLMGFGALVWLLRALLREGLRQLDAHVSSPQGGQEPAEGAMNLWFGFLIDAVAFLVFLPPALVMLGLEWAVVRDGLHDALFGFEIGGIRLSLWKILTAIGIFLALVYVTRLVQRTAETRIFAKSRMDTGVRDSLKTLIGYAGIILALAVSVTTLGFDLSNLAIIAGALSIGIGFGLQSIVNNFVSGLILLFERPIKVGDWIVTPSGEGIVKRISVRSTEIQTFSRASVIVPNSELISSAVTNWTHKSTLGRVELLVGVSYDADPEEVIAILEEAANECELMLRYPPPYVYFADFGDSALIFDLRGFIRDIGNVLKVRTALRIAIFKKLKAAGISIPFPQRDLHIRSEPGES